MGDQLKIKSPLRYPGGKSRAAQRIAARVPFFEEYREPFLGGGSIFVHLKQLYPNKKFWVNDLYQELFYFWTHCQTADEALIEQVNVWRTAFSDGKALFNFLTQNMPSFSKLEKASAFFVFNRITFSGTTEAGGYSAQAYQGRFTPSSIERLRPFSTLLKEVQITNFDYPYLLNAPGENVFIFLDPPYFSATKSALYGKKGSLHKGFDHEAFAEQMKACPHKWLITYDDSAYIRELFSFAEINAWNLTYGMRNIRQQSTQQGEELFISNYPIHEHKDFL